MNWNKHGPKKHISSNDYRICQKRTLEMFAVACSDVPSKQKMVYLFWACDHTKRTSFFAEAVSCMSAVFWIAACTSSS